MGSHLCICFDFCFQGTWPLYEDSHGTHWEFPSSFQKALRGRPRTKGAQAAASRLPNHGPSTLPRPAPPPTSFLRLKKKMFFWLHLETCGILVSWPGTEPRHPAVEVSSLNHWTACEVYLRLTVYFFLADFKLHLVKPNIIIKEKVMTLRGRKNKPS